MSAIIATLIGVPVAGGALETDEPEVDGPGAVVGLVEAAALVELDDDGPELPHAAASSPTTTRVMQCSRSRVRDGSAGVDPSSSIWFDLFRRERLPSKRLVTI
jgi:hypothetical protein